MSSLPDLIISNNGKTLLTLFPGMSLTPVIITPEIARAMLLRNVANRMVRTKHFLAIAQDILDGQWRLTADAIRFDEHGNLSDGQHRLYGVCQADKPISTYVYYGLTDDAKIYVDRNLGRQLSDNITFNPDLSQNQNRRIVALINYYNKFINNATLKTSPLLALDIYSKHQYWIDWCVSFQKTMKNIGSASMWLALGQYYLLDAFKATEFTHSLISLDSVIQQASKLSSYLLLCPNRSFSSPKNWKPLTQRIFYCCGCHYRGEVVEKVIPANFIDPRNISYEMNVIKRKTPYEKDRFLKNK